jgi:hypothetical protein
VDVDGGVDRLNIFILCVCVGVCVCVCMRVCVWDVFCPTLWSGRFGRSSTIVSGTRMLLLLLQYCMGFHGIGWNALTASY